VVIIALLDKVIKWIRRVNMTTFLFLFHPLLSRCPGMGVSGAIEREETTSMRKLVVGTFTTMENPENPGKIRKSGTLPGF
jgi:hypothetical protein